MEQTNTLHGVRKGRRLSPRRLVGSMIQIQGGRTPDRAYQETDPQMDTSMSAAVVLDESGSMSGILRDVTRILCAITEPLDALGCPVQVSGFRDGWRETQAAYREPGDNGHYHREGAGIVHDIFKTFDEPLRTVKWRFANTRATGGTPMADGIQFALMSLSGRTEGHRIMFVVTDGMPNGGHGPIIKRQIRLANAAGIHVIGVGLGHGAEYVKDVFPDHVWTAQVSDMPKALISKLNELVDTRMTRKRGRRIKHD
jgi:nitric oxide reductase activation protein